MKGAIHRVSREREEDRTNATLRTAWVGNGQATRSWSGGALLSRHWPASLVDDASPILVMLGTEAVADEILSRHMASSRAYVLAGPDVDFDAPSRNMLIRRVPEVPVSAFHSASERRVWIGGGLSLKLDDQQAEALRLMFLRLFWHEATDEAWFDGRELSWRPARERPFDIPELAASASIRWEAPDARIHFDLRGARVHLVGEETPPLAPRRLWFHAGGAHHDRLAENAQAGTEVIWDDLGLPDLAVTESAGEVLLPGKRGRLRIRLTPAQSKEATALLDEGASWTFRSEVRIGAPEVRRACFWLAGEGEARAIEEQQIIDVPTVSAPSLRDVHVSEPTSWPAPQPLALSALYRWAVMPPRVPARSEEDPLVKRWRSLDDDWTKRLATVRTTLKGSEGERSRIGKAFSRLLSGLLGFERRHGELIEQAAALEAERPSKAGPSGAPGLLSRLEKLEESTRKHQEDLEDAERKAREDEEREKQQAEWSAQIERARKDAATARGELSSAEARDTELANEAQAIETQLEGAVSDEKKDLDVKQKKNSDERKKHAERLKKLRYDLKKHEADGARPFTFRASRLDLQGQQAKGKRFVPTATTTRSSSSIPEDALPEVGILRTFKGQRYLVIDVWEHLDAGELAASRLSAKLVAPEGA